jgi:Ca2+-binding EF-hand superfamily protein
MTEIESISLSLGYTREYCKKLFFALDTKNRGYLTMEQFARPLPVINKELCLLMKESST